MYQKPKDTTKDVCLRKIFKNIKLIKPLDLTMGKKRDTFTTTTEMESENKNIGNLTGQANLDKKLKKERGGKREGDLRAVSTKCSEGALLKHINYNKPEAIREI